MNENVADRERQRAVWTQARRSLGLVDVQSDDFAAGGLGARLPELSARFLILPADPEKAIAEFDEDLWKWWLALDSRVEGRTIDWGHEHRATASAMVRHDRASDNVWEWNRYLAMHRTGALEFGLGRLGARRWNEARIFFLIGILGRTWASMLQYRSVLETLAPTGPWELTLALSGTEGSYLGNLGEGWAEPQNLSDYELLPCVEPNILIRLEFVEWPVSDDAVQEVAFAIGGRIEDAWGMTQRRFLAHRGANIGKFDAARIHS